MPVCGPAARAQHGDPREAPRMCGCVLSLPPLFGSPQRQSAVLLLQVLVEESLSLFSATLRYGLRCDAANVSLSGSGFRAATSL